MLLLLLRDDRDLLDELRLVKWMRLVLGRGVVRKLFKLREVVFLDLLDLLDFLDFLDEGRCASFTTFTEDGFLFLGAFTRNLRVLGVARLLRVGARRRMSMWLGSTGDNLYTLIHQIVLRQSVVQRRRDHRHL